MNDRYAARAQRGEQLRRTRNHRIASFGGGEGCHCGIEMATIYVDGDECGARRIEGNHGHVTPWCSGGLSFVLLAGKGMQLPQRHVATPARAAPIRRGPRSSSRRPDSPKENASLDYST